MKLIECVNFLKRSKLILSIERLEDTKEISIYPKPTVYSVPYYEYCLAHWQGSQVVENNLYMNKQQKYIYYFLFLFLLNMLLPVPTAYKGQGRR
jgi:hypothetical protein